MEERDEAHQIVRIPANIAGAYFNSEEFRWLHCADKIRGDWVEEKGTGKTFYEFYDVDPDDLKYLVRSIEQFTSNKVQNK